MAGDARALGNMLGALGSIRALSLRGLDSISSHLTASLLYQEQKFPSTSLFAFNGAERSGAHKH
jgi:hypothetical protein